MNKNQALDLTRGNPLPLLIRFAIPLGVAGRHWPPFSARPSAFCSVFGG